MKTTCLCLVSSPAFQEGIPSAQVGGGLCVASSAFSLFRYFFAIKNNIFSLVTISVLDALTVRLKLETKISHIVRCCPFRNMPRNVARERKIRVLQ